MRSHQFMNLSPLVSTGSRPTPPPSIFANAGQVSVELRFQFPAGFFDRDEVGAIQIGNVVSALLGFFLKPPQEGIFRLTGLLQSPS